MRNVSLHLGDCMEVLTTFPDKSIDAVVTSPPYAMQRKDFYGGVPEEDYPEWMVQWARPLKRVLSDNGNIAVNIRENLKGGQISDYVHRSRLAMREDGWVECDEIIWYKPSSPPVGSVNRPRRSWERVLWFAKHGRSYCDPRANGRESDKVGMSESRHGWVNGTKPGVVRGVARSTDVVTVSVSSNDSTGHPAVYPVDLAAWLVRMLSPWGATVLDPFMGSGSTGIACLRNGRNFSGIEINPEYYDMAKDRIGRIDLSCLPVRRM